MLVEVIAVNLPIVTAWRETPLLLESALLGASRQGISTYHLLRLQAVVDLMKLRS